MCTLSLKNLHLFEISYLDFLVIFQIFFPSFIFAYECDFQTPFFYEGGCVSFCYPNDLESHICEVNNTLIKDQWLNNIITFININEVTYHLSDFCLTTKEELILLLSSNDEDFEGNRLFYNIKNNGRGFFSNGTDDTPLYLFQTTLNSKEETIIFPFKLNNTNDNKEYILAISSTNIFEIYDINENKRYFTKTFNDLYNKGIIYKESSIPTYIESGNNYYLGNLGQWRGSSGYSFYINKLSFNSLEADKFHPLIKYKSIDVDEDSYIVSCYKTEITRTYIICFYHEYSGNYKAIAFDENLEKLGEETIKEWGNSNYFFKCVHFFDEVGVFGYFENYQFNFKFKLFNEGNNFVDYFNERAENVMIDYIEFEDPEHFNYDANDLIKLDDKKICFTSKKLNLNSLYIVIIHEFNDSKIKLRYYKINLKLYSVNNFSKRLRTLVYNNFISLTSYFDQDFSQYEERHSASLIIFSYPNCKDFKLDITNFLTQHHNITIDLNLQCQIDNNIFGLIRKEFKIIDFPEIFKIYSSKDDRKINKGESLKANETLIVILSRNENVNIPTLGRIEYAMVVTEPDYDEYNSYTYLTECDCLGKEDDENNGYYIKKNYTGRYSYCDIKVDESQVNQPLWE